MTRYALVLGNGPSLRDVHLNALTDDVVHTIGLNAAYRHWDRIGWYPTYYCCLDDRLIETHHIEIRRLVEQGQVKGAFIHGAFFELYPELLNDSRFWSLDRFIPAFYAKRGQYLGLPFDSHPAFQTNHPNKLTTGSHSVRFLAYLGYKKIGLLGIDLRYVEILPETERADGIGLVMRKTPNENPNYYFADYQRAGDLYNVPNPAVHDGALHINAFRAIRDDFKHFGVDVSVYNLNSNSELYTQDVFSYYPLKNILGKTLSSVVIPCNQREVQQILVNLRLWSLPQYAPFSNAPVERPILAFIFNNDSGKEASNAITDEFNRLGLDRFFRGPTFEFLNLHGDADNYARVYSTATVEGYRAGPNNQFFQTMRLAKQYGRYSFLMETDCVPIRSGWLERLCNLVAWSEDFFIMGSVYRGVGGLPPTYSRHINGNAVYASGDPEFHEFIDTLWEPRLREMIRDQDRRVAYDCIPEIVFRPWTACWATIPFGRSGRR